LPLLYETPRGQTTLAPKIPSAMLYMWQNEEKSYFKPHFRPCSKNSFRDVIHVTNEEKSYFKPHFRPHCLNESPQKLLVLRLLEFDWLILHNRWHLTQYNVNRP
jgi:hypothetical protein